MTGVHIHCEPQIGWQGPFARKMQRGLTNLGIYSEITNARNRMSDIAILLGTTCWRHIEKTGRYLLVDRCSFGDTNEWVTLVWDGHGRRGDFKARRAPERWEAVGWPIPERVRGENRVLCGQTEAYSPLWGLDEWYNEVRGHCTHFRAHPAGQNRSGLPAWDSFENCGQMVTLNSSVGVEAVMRGIPTVTMDQAAMAWEVTAHYPTRDFQPDSDQVQEWLHWLAWTQWRHDEIEAGLPVKHLFEEL